MGDFPYKVVEVENPNVILMTMFIGVQLIGGKFAVA